MCAYIDACMSRLKTAKTPAKNNKKFKVNPISSEIGKTTNQVGETTRDRRSHWIYVETDWIIVASVSGAVSGDSSHSLITKISHNNKYWLLFYCAVCTIRTPNKTYTKTKGFVEVAE